MEHPRDDAESARRRTLRALYGPSPSPDAVERLQGAPLVPEPSTERSSLEAAHDDGRAAPLGARPPSLRKRVAILVAGVLLLVAVVLGARLALGNAVAGPTRPSSPQQAAAPDAFSAAPQRVLLAHDSGTRRYAAGSAVVVGNGVFRYTTAAGDTFLGIASRFHVCIADLEGGRPLADQGQMLTARTPITIELGNWPEKPDGAVDCVWDK